MQQRIRRALLVGMFVIGSAPAALGAAAPAGAKPSDVRTYRSVQVLPDPGSGEALGVNDFGEAAGDVTAPGGQPQAAMWLRGRLHLIPTGLVRSAALSVNDAGLVVGQGLDADGMRHAWEWRGRGNAVLLPAPIAGSDNVQVRQVNQFGTIVGNTDDASGEPHATVWTGEHHDPRLLPGLRGSAGSLGHGVNNFGMVAGSSVADDGTTTPTLWGSDGDAHRLAPVGGPAEAWSVNDRGLVVGYGMRHRAATGPSVFLAWYGGAVHDLGTLPGDDDASPNALNDRDLAVGFSASDLHPRDSGATRAVYWPGCGGLRRLPTLPGSTFSTAHDVNAWNLIVGLAADRSGAIHAVVWWPTAHG